MIFPALNLHVSYGGFSIVIFEHRQSLAPQLWGMDAQGALRSKWLADVKDVKGCKSVTTQWVWHGMAKKWNTPQICWLIIMILNLPTWWHANHFQTNLNTILTWLNPNFSYLHHVKSQLFTVLHYFWLLNEPIFSPYSPDLLQKSLGDSTQKGWAPQQGALRVFRRSAQWLLDGSVVDPLQSPVNGINDETLPFRGPLPKLCLADENN